MGIQNARRQSGRSLLTAGLVASACFLIVALEAFHLDVDPGSHERKSGTGGYTHYAESAVPLLYDLNSKTGRESLNVDPIVGRVLDDVSFISFRLRPGEGSGCTNLYHPTQPRILGATPAMLERGGFAFSSTMAQTQAERENPWKLLNKEFPDGAVPIIGDEASVLWQLHLGLGKDLVMEDGGGREVHLRFVALLSGSALQDELVVSESSFERLFPTINGYNFFLIESQLTKIDDVEHALEEQLAPFGFDVGTTSARLAGYLVVQNTYLRTFQTLGGFGLILGTIGLAAVLLRNVWERRGELALMQAGGFSKKNLGLIVLGENLWLLLLGLVTGTVSALWAVAPHLVTRAGAIPWLSLGSTLMIVLVVGVLAGVVALAVAFRAPLLPALRSE